MGKSHHTCTQNRGGIRITTVVLHDSYCTLAFTTVKERMNNWMGCIMIGLAGIRTRACGFQDRDANHATTQTFIHLLVFPDTSHIPLTPRFTYMPSSPSSSLHMTQRSPITISINNTRVTHQPTRFRHFPTLQLSIVLFHPSFFFLRHFNIISLFPFYSF